MPATDRESRERRFRVSLVRRLLIRGVTSVTEIQEYLQGLKNPIVADDRTIYRYLADIKAEHRAAVERKEGLTKPLEELAIELRENFDEVSRELWKVYYSKSSTAAAKVSALKEIRETSRNWLEMMQSLGFAFKVPDKTQYIGADGKPVDPTINIDKVQMNQQFIAFIKAQYQDPLAPPKNESA